MMLDLKLSRIGFGVPELQKLGPRMIFKLLHICVCLKEGLH